MSRKRKDEEEYYEEGEERKLSILKRLGITLLVILGIIVIFFLLRGCGDNKKEKDLNTLLLEAGKEYYEYNKFQLPSSIGDCNTVSLERLFSEGLLDKNKFKTCENDDTYVKVCKLESGKYHFVAFLDCENEKTEELYGEWTEGKESDIIVDSSDLKFLFKVEYLNIEDSTLGDMKEFWEEEIPFDKYKTESITKFYRYKDLQYIWNITSNRYYPNDKANASEVKEYYTSSPKSEYTYKDSENKNVSKYYSVSESKEYWVNENGTKKVAASAPEGYPYPDNPISQTRYRTRSWIETSKPIETAPTQIWYCSSPIDTLQVTSFVPCEQNVNNPSHIITERMIYSCDGGLTEVGQNGVCHQCKDGQGLNSDKTSCGYFGPWSSYTTTKCEGSELFCQSLTITGYNWYKIIETRKYYPSNKATANEEKVYYASSPASNLIKDTSTTTTGWKWYKKVSAQTTNYYTLQPQEGATKTNMSKWSNFTDWNTFKPESLGNNGTRVIEVKSKIKLREILNGKEEWLVFNKDFMELDKLLIQLQEKGYKVYSLDDINSSGELKYKVKLYLRNKEVKNNG